MKNINNFNNFNLINSNQVYKDNVFDEKGQNGEPASKKLHSFAKGI